ncbi:helix-turn-helix domain-containing protein [Salmonella enterica]|uniref:Transcriptional regulator n=1 Tax=Salmonella newport TaxID=108619 RepID=A0A5U9VJI9_SALNE|nr:transcriptional regulator [Salmonella enterica subsp. enterica serovar Newport]ECH9843518.1 helix-turn-helix domain-containing protein [Salmonella enterica subsp. enterica serovar Hvittingfoss]ECI2262968.1 helix-turn-helix domain-containing protein [Salmonella enterica subsp. enterica serovar Wandsworth]ECJ2315706.1 helix-turn-helix domain-containing protein [Salmonella enterica subsp. diarizonae]EIO3283144.1 helix-turn-helix domain-containing protein [Salmonella enterica]
MIIGEKIRSIREAEELTREEFCALIDVPIGTLRRYETGRIENIGSDTLVKIVNHPRFFKYMNWLMTGTTNEAAGQISPSLSPDGQVNTSHSQTPRKTGTRHG